MARDDVKQAFVEAFDLPHDTDVEAMEIGKDPRWDSLGHMTLIAELETRFSIALETDDVIEMTSFNSSIAILQRHGVQL